MNDEISSRSSTGSKSGDAFTLTELLAVLCTIALLTSIILPVLARDVDSSDRAVCLSNVRHIVTAMAMYATDNNDHLPHSTWGSDLTGPDGWAYATINPSRSGASFTGPEAAASCAGYGVDSQQFSNQVQFYKIGQLASYLESQRVLICPTDWRESISTERPSYIARPQKLTSYSMSGTVGGYSGPKSGLIPNGTTYKTSDFLPTDILLWEQNETQGFYFNDAVSDPEVGGEGLSRRHVTDNGEGSGVVGRSGATADFMKWGAFNKFLQSPKPNDLLCGPGYQ